MHLYEMLEDFKDGENTDVRVELANCFRVRLISGVDEWFYLSDLTGEGLLNVLTPEMLDV